jgi:hypothetical protein
VNFAVYGSGNLLLASVDKVSGRALLTIVDDEGEELGQLSLADNDYGAKMGAVGATEEARAQSLGMLLSLAQFVSHGDNLLLIRSEAGCRSSR